MTTLSKEDVEKLWWQSNQDIFIFTVLARADLVAENERLKEMARFFSTYTDPDELEMDEIENAARESFRRANSGVRGTTITRANSYESHVIWATKARISKELTATRTALAAAEARERNYISALKYHAEVNCSNISAYELRDKALAQPRDDSALREMIAGVYEECALFVEPQRNDIPATGTEFAAAIRMWAELRLRALAEKHKDNK